MAHKMSQSWHGASHTRTHIPGNWKPKTQHPNQHDGLMEEQVELETVDTDRGSGSRISLEWVKIDTPRVSEEFQIQLDDIPRLSCQEDFYTLKHAAQIEERNTPKEGNPAKSLIRYPTEEKQGPEEVPFISLRNISAIMKPGNYRLRKRSCRKGFNSHQREQIWSKLVFLHSPLPVDKRNRYAELISEIFEPTGGIVPFNLRVLIFPFFISCFINRLYQVE